MIWYILTDCNGLFSGPPNDQGEFEFIHPEKYYSIESLISHLTSRFLKINVEEIILFSDLNDLFKNQFLEQLKDLIQNSPIQSIIQTNCYGNEDCCRMCVFKQIEDDCIFLAKNDYDKIYE